MNPKLKLALYLVLGIGLAVCIQGLLTASRQGAGPAGSTAAGTNLASPTNAAVVASNVVATKLAATNPATTNAAATNTSTAEQSTAIDEGTARKSSPRMGRFMAYGVAGFFVVVGLAILIGHDLSRFFATRVDNFIFND